MDRDKITIETWDKIASLYQDVFMELDLYNDSYDLFCSRIRPAGRLFEIGCGPGNITRYITDNRPDLSIDAIDVAPNMVELAQKNIPSGNFRVLDCRNIDTITKKYDAILCGFCIPYISKEECCNFIENCNSLLVPGGVLYLSCIEGDYDQSGFEIGSTGDQAYVHYYTEEFVLDELNKNKFTNQEIVKIKYVKRDGKNQIHLIFIANKQG